MRVGAVRGEEDTCAVFDAELQGRCRVPGLVLSRVEDLDVTREADSVGFVGCVLDIPEELNEATKWGQVGRWRTIHLIRVARMRRVRRQSRRSKRVGSCSGSRLRS